MLKCVISYVKKYFNRKPVEVQPWTSLEVILNEFCLRITVRCMQRSLIVGVATSNSVLLSSSATKRLLFIALCWRRYNYICAGHLIFAINTCIEPGKKITQGMATAHWLLYTKRCMHACHLPLRTQWTNISWHSSGLRLNASATKIWALNILHKVTGPTLSPN